MINSGINITVQPSAVVPVNPIGRLPVGLENVDAKEQIFTPVEESPRSSDGTNRDNDRVSDRDENTRQREQQQQQQQQERQQEQRQAQQQQSRDQEIIRDLAARDREVRAHEAAHAAVGGRYAGSPSYTFQRGPDGVNYAVAGEVPISLPSSSSADPEEALAAAQQVRRAALAPATPSTQDRAVAAQAAQIELQARADIAELMRNERREAENTDGDNREQSSIASEGAQVERPAPVSAREDIRRDQLSFLEQITGPAARLSEQLSTIDNLNRQSLAGIVVDQRV